LKNHISSIRLYRILFSVLLIFLLLPDICYSQGGLRIGYGFAVGNPKDVNRIIYVYNMRGGFEKEMPYIWNAHGLTFAYYKALADDLFWEFKWQNRHSIVSARKEVSGVMMQRDLKLRQNFFSAGFYGGKPFYAGLSIELGNWKGFTRVNTVDSIKKTEYIKIFTVNEGFESEVVKTMQPAFSIYGGYETDFFGIRLCYQYQFMKRATDQLDNELLGGNIEDGNYPMDKFSNLGIELYIKLGKR